MESTERSQSELIFKADEASDCQVPGHVTRDSYVSCIICHYAIRQTVKTARRQLMLSDDTQQVDIVRTVRVFEYSSVCGPVATIAGRHVPELLG